MLTFIETSQGYQNQGKSIRKVFSGFGATKWSTFSEPITNRTEEESIALLLNWLPRNLPREDTMALRMRDDCNQDVYEMEVINKRGCIQFNALWKRALMNEQMLYCWPPNVTPNTLTIAIIQQSMKVASHINAQRRSSAQLLYPHTYNITSNASYQHYAPPVSSIVECKPLTRT